MTITKLSKLSFRKGEGAARALGARPHEAERAEAARVLGGAAVEAEGLGDAHRALRAARDGKENLREN